MFWVGNPRVHFVPGDAHEAAGRIQPERLIVVLHRPVNRIAGQTVLAGERSDAAIFKPAEAALGCDPQCPIPIESKVGDSSLAQATSGRVGCADLTILKIQHAPFVPESKPHSAWLSSGEQNLSTL